LAINIQPKSKKPLGKPNITEPDMRSLKLIKNDEKQQKFFCLSSTIAVRNVTI
jgi:hypothetical protein